MILDIPVYELLRDEYREAILTLLAEKKIGFSYPDEGAKHQIVWIFEFGKDPHLLEFVLHEAQHFQALYERDSSRFTYLQRSGATAKEIAATICRSSDEGRRK